MAQGSDSEESRIPFGEHLIELRTRLVVCVIASLIGMVVAYVFYVDVFYPMIRAPLDAIQGRETENPFVLRTPLLDLLARRGGAEARPGQTKADADQRKAEATRLHYQSMIVPFMMRLKVSLVIGIILALPLILYEIWKFVSAGLYPRERKLVLIYGPGSLLLFLAGVALAYFVALPLAAAFLVQQGELVGLKPILTLDQYAPFVMWLLLGFGLVFEMPLVILFLTKIGLVTHRTLGRYRRHAILAIVIVAALVTPTPDPFTQLVMAVPMYGLYELGILLSWRVARKKARESAE